MNANLAAILYLVAGVLFILSLRGLSSPATSRQGNLFGMIGMAIAVATTLAVHPPADGMAWVLVILIGVFTLLVFRSSKLWVHYEDGGKS